MRYLYGVTDEKFVKDPNESRKRPAPLSKYCFSVHPFLSGKPYFDRNSVPYKFKVSPDTLLNLCINVIDAFPLPMVYTWDNMAVCKWIREYGYRHYQNTFRENMLNGRTLLLVNAAALSAMNIKNFADIKHIAYGIRCLFYFEMTKFARSISLPPEYYYELYKLLRVKNGLKYESMRRSDLWRKMQLVRKKSPNLCHWELLERWLALMPDPEEPELFGGVRRFRLYKCKKASPGNQQTPQLPKQVKFCGCMPPCECHWTEDEWKPPTRFSILKPRPPEPPITKPCHCIPPCTCYWSPKSFWNGQILTCLQDAFPMKYGGVRLYHRRI